MLPIKSREYKIMLDHRAFADREPAVGAFWQETADFAGSFGIDSDGVLEEKKLRDIIFLDTIDFLLNQNAFILRRRQKTGASKAEFTLKSRSEDRYIAAGTDVSEGGAGTEPDPKFEEDIAALFRSRYSKSNSLKVSGDFQIPKDLGDAAKLFPVLQTLSRDGLICPPETPLTVVNNVRAFERVYEGPTLEFGAKAATVALILWSQGPGGRPLVAEFSFRYEHDSEEFPPGVASIARTFFLQLQKLDWCRPTAMTKTEYVYRTAASD